MRIPLSNLLNSSLLLSMLAVAGSAAALPPVRPKDPVPQPRPPIPKPAPLPKPTPAPPPAPMPPNPGPVSPPSAPATVIESSKPVRYDTIYPIETRFPMAGIYYERGDDGVCEPGDDFHFTGRCLKLGIPSLHDGTTYWVDTNPAWPGLYYKQEGGKCPWGGVPADTNCHVVRFARTILNTAVYTNFKPAYGFKFKNSFKNAADFGLFDVRTGGLCGGMSYAAIDYFMAGRPVPTQSFVPAEGDPLREYFMKRQILSLTTNLDKWAEVGFNPEGARNSEFFKWGLQDYNGGRIQELRAKIDNNQVALLGMPGAGGSGNHQVIAYGYDMGRYKGDLGAYQEDFRIFVLDPNYPNETRTLIPVLNGEYYTYAEEPGVKKYQTYFVDSKYFPVTPPDIKDWIYPNDGKVYGLLLKFGTGDDDLRGDRGNINVTVNFANGTQKIFLNVNQSRKWMSNDEMSVPLRWSNGVDEKDIYDIRISDNLWGDVAGNDNWDMSWVRVSAFKGSGFDELTIAGAHRFTGGYDNFIIPIHAEDATNVHQLILTTVTGADNLRGVDDNVNILIKYKDGDVQTAFNVNENQEWKNHSTHVSYVTLDRVASIQDIAGITVSTDFAGGCCGENWNMDSMQIAAELHSGFRRTIGNTAGPIRFTGEVRTLYVPVK